MHTSHNGFGFYELPLKNKSKNIHNVTKNKKLLIRYFHLVSLSSCGQNIMIRHISWVIQTPSCDGAVSNPTVLQHPLPFYCHFFLNFFLLSAHFLSSLSRFHRILGRIQSLTYTEHLWQLRHLHNVQYCTCTLTTLLFLSLSPVAYIYLCTVYFSPPPLWWICRAGILTK